ncbi:hypothetical protein M0D21_13065 [Aquimarina sp. D1M17]|uniref:hypothetical protein n=1 Tax=Aquimarina acroporae TaxID=2937283 RepID=UPI0020BD6423|nr:hypothetical protein [Aquimarina acroporae]MCK8522508.1 hypothetical protein [Aquimarina acroporae]
MKKEQKSIDALLKNLENQKEAVKISEDGKTTQYWCGTGANAADELAGHPPKS